MSYHFKHILILHYAVVSAEAYRYQRNYCPEQVPETHFFN